MQGIVCEYYPVYYFWFLNSEFCHFPKNVEIRILSWFNDYVISHFTVDFNNSNVQSYETIGLISVFSKTNFFFKDSSWITLNSRD